VNDPSTNRDIYRAITDLTEDPTRAPARDLEEYLRALLRLCRDRRTAPALSIEDFLAMLAGAFVAAPLPYDPAWADGYDRDVTDADGEYTKFEATLLRQVVDLREMRQAGILDGEWIGLGVDAPRGGRWFNFDPRQFLECATAGAVGGWKPGDLTGRDFVPGPLAALDADGNLRSADPRDVPHPVRPLDAVTWGQFEDFLYCGQIYE
jgi:hypothetical protein